tara:strand:+ start:21 stop:1232 length:1212 start_codon:yes stop_codon:yes gene_type:complete
MEKKINKFLLYYLVTLFIFGIFFLYEKHTVGNDSTISEWLINYSGGFTKRGIIGQLSIYISNLFNFSLRETILIFQISILLIYFLTLYSFFKNINQNKIILLAVFTPIFILYPIAEIEVLARKEIFIFTFFLFYLSLNSNVYRVIYKITILPLAVLIWEPVIFFFSFWFAIDIIEERIKKIDKNFFKIIFTFLPAIIICIYIALNPISEENHSYMAWILKSYFNENCYMSCSMLIKKSTIFQQFTVNFESYSFIAFLRYFLIILVGFSPLFYLTKYSFFSKKSYLFFNYFKNLLVPLLILLTPALLLFAMGSDWGRWVNISYFFSVIFYFYLYKKKIILLSKDIFKNNFISLITKEKIFVVFFIIFCFGWNPKTAITGDVATKPGYQIPRKAIKIIYYKYIKD